MSDQPWSAQFISTFPVRMYWINWFPLKFCWIPKGTTNICKWFLWLSKCVMVMTKIECYLPAIYRLNQELLREECRIDTLDYENQNNQTIATLSYMLINFLVWTLQCTKILFFLSFILSIKTFFSTFLVAKKALVRQK